MGNLSAPQEAEAVRCRRELVAFLEPLAGPRAHRVGGSLIAEFGSADAVLMSSMERLLAVDGVDAEIAASLTGARSLMTHCLRRRVVGRSVLSNWADVIDYLHLDMSLALSERVRVLHLNGRNVLIRDEVTAEGSIDSAKVYVREIMRRALELGSSRLVLAHNHPTGDPTPSQSDVDLTRRVAQAGMAIDVRVLDHVIVGSSGYHSMREHNQI